MFEVGNRVRCINAVGSRLLNQGGLYTVSFVSPQGLAIKLEGIEQAFASNRFELYVPPAVPIPAPQPAANIRRTEEVQDTQYLVVMTHEDNDPTYTSEYSYSYFNDEESAQDHIHAWVRNDDYILIAKKKLSFTFNVEI